MKTNPQGDAATTSEAMQHAAVDGGELEYEVREDGEPMLFIHGAHIAASFHPLITEPLPLLDSLRPDPRFAALMSNVRARA